MTTNILSAERLRELLRYDPETGIFTWIASRSNVKAGASAGCLNNAGYFQIQVDKCIYLSHRLAWLYVHGRFPLEDTDHINGVRSDNRFINLREATRSENMQNQRRARSNNKTSGMLGVSWNKKEGKWLAQIRTNGEGRCIGRFPTPELAHTAYITAKRKYHEFGTL